MSSITNLFVFPSGSNLSPGPSALQVAAAWVEEGWMAPLCRYGRPFREDNDLIEPNAAFNAYGGAEALHTTPTAEKCAVIDLLTSLRPPALAAFGGFDCNNPLVEEDFDLYQGYECCIGAYSVQGGYRLILKTDPGLDPAFPMGELIFDRVLRDWIHLQGKLAPPQTQFLNARLSALTRTKWPDMKVVEFAYH